MTIPAITIPSSRASEDYPSQFIHPNRQAVVGDMIYGILADGVPYRCPNTERVDVGLIDSEFAAPVAAYLKAHGLNAENIRSVRYDMRGNTVIYTWPSVSFLWLLKEEAWSAPQKQSYEPEGVRLTDPYPDGILATGDGRVIGMGQDVELRGTKDEYRPDSRPLIFDEGNDISFAELDGRELKPLSETVKRELSAPPQKHIVYSNLGVEVKPALCSRCGGVLSGERVAVCEECEPDAV